jgi:DNA-binding ferritin-like protein
MEDFIKALEKYQATTHVTALNLHNLHWNLESNIFFALHPYLGDLYDTVSDFEDEIAEQIRFLEERPLTTLSEIANLSLVDDLSSQSFTAETAIRIALDDIQSLYAVAKDVVAKADANNIWAAVEKFSAHLVSLEKIIYFLRSSKKTIG